MADRDRDGYTPLEGSVRKRDGLFLPGEEVAKFHKDGTVTKRDNPFFDRTLGGRIKGDRVVSEGGILGECEYGYVDANKQVWLSFGIIGKRVIGEMRGNNPQQAFAYYIAKYDDLEQEVDELEREARSEFDKSPFYGKVQGKIAYLDKARVLGDIDRLKRQLQNLLGDIESNMNRNANAAQNLIYKAEIVAESGDWKGGKQKLEELMEEWKALGRLPSSVRELLWEKFQRARQEFFDARKRHFDARDREQQDNIRAKRELIRQVERLARASDSREAKSAVKEAQAEWKQIGHVPRDEADDLWASFRSACDEVYAAAREADIARFESRIESQEEFIEKLRASNSKAEDFIDQLEGYNNPPWDKISEVRDQIRSKEDKISEVEGQISELRSRIWDLKR